MFLDINYPSRVSLKPQQPQQQLARSHARNQEVNTTEKKLGTFTTEPPKWRMTTQISPDELHLLVYRFLQESGFEHSAYVFSSESLLGSTKVATADVPCGALISFIHKGLLFEQMEREIEDAKRTKLMANANESLVESNAANGRATVPPLVLRGHEKEVFVCSFHPKQGSLLATASKDTTARIWKIEPEESPTSIVLEHVSPDVQSVEVVALSWAPSGDMLATGASDGKIRLWSADGTLVSTLGVHGNIVVSLKWSSRGGKLICGAENRVSVWDVETQAMLQVFTPLTNQTMDVDWCPSCSDEEDDYTFAVCSKDKSVVVIRMSDNQQVRLDGHDADVNEVKWSSDSKMLASCSDDCKAIIWKNIWSENPEKTELIGHTKQIFAIQWSPRLTVLASASCDSNVKIWNVDSGELLHNLDKQTSAVYALEFDRTGEHLLSGALDGFVNVWNVDNGHLVKSLQAGAGVHHVSWNLRSDKIAAAAADGSVSVLDF